MEAKTSSSKKLVLFDFDGTMADTMLPGLKISNILADRYKYKKVQKDELAEYRGTDTREVLKRINLAWYKLPFVTRSFRIAMQAEIGKIDAFEGIKEVISELHNRGYILGIFTSNGESNINEFLHNNKLENYFTIKKCGIGLFKKHHYLKRLLSKMDFDPSEVLLIADETRDIESAKKSGIDIISVTWGFHTKNALANCNPNFLIDTPHEILDIL